MCPYFNSDGVDDKGKKKPAEIIRRLRFFGFIAQ